MSRCTGGFNLTEMRRNFYLQLGKLHEQLSDQLRQQHALAVRKAIPVETSSAFFDINQLHSVAAPRRAARLPLPAELKECRPDALAPAPAAPPRRPAEVWAGNAEAAGAGNDAQDQRWQNFVDGDEVPRAPQRQPRDRKRRERREASTASAAAQKPAELTLTSTRLPPPQRQFHRPRQLAEDRLHWEKLYPVPHRNQLRLQLTNVEIDECRKAFASQDREEQRRMPPSCTRDALKQLGLRASEQLVHRLLPSQTAPLDFLAFLDIVIAVRAARDAALAEAVRSPRTPSPRSKKGMGPWAAATKRASQDLRNQTTVDLSTEEFTRFKAAFDEIDTEGTGFIDRGLIEQSDWHFAGRKLDPGLLAPVGDSPSLDRSTGHTEQRVSLRELLQAAYPNVPSRSLQRLLIVHDNRTPLGNAPTNHRGDWTQCLTGPALEEVCDMFDLYSRGELTPRGMRRVAQNSQLSGEALDAFLQESSVLLRTRKPLPVVPILQYMYCTCGG
eukprot:TRINITY_DN20389_c0_g1_i1.p1 TRINITY_DN20389_c0_g1~~TRINITY_DN20389_c0_g1_i1.p1  ORF type:complete len:499 (-),score=66.95 TRINITY_DN20389_c0_g1_i1:18-1514(-)